MTEQDDFAQRFGELLQRYVDSLGLSLSEVAIRVWGSRGRGRESHVSAYLKGTRGKPSATTIRSFCEALGIGNEEVAACRRKPTSNSEVGAAVLEQLGLTEALFFNLATRFGHQNPNANVAEYTTFLKKKAEEYKLMHGRLVELSKYEEQSAARDRLDNMLKSVQGAILDGAFDEADEILEAAEETQLLEHTKREVSKLSAIRESRADTNLLRGNISVAARQYEAAANMLREFDYVEYLEKKNDYLSRLFKYGTDNSPKAFSAASDLAQSIIHEFKQGKIIGGSEEVFDQALIMAAITRDPKGKLTEKNTNTIVEILTERGKVANLRDSGIISNATVGLAITNSARRIKSPSRMITQMETGVSRCRSARNQSAMTGSDAGKMMAQAALGNSLLIQAEHATGGMSLDRVSKSKRAFLLALRLMEKAEQPKEKFQILMKLGWANNIQAEKGEKGDRLECWGRATGWFRKAKEMLEDSPQSSEFAEANLELACCIQMCVSERLQNASEDIVAEGLLSANSAIKHFSHGTDKFSLNRAKSCHTLLSNIKTIAH